MSPARLFSTLVLDIVARLTPTLRDALNARSDAEVVAAARAAVDILETGAAMLRITFLPVPQSGS